jgi:hypothetical protein
MESIQDKFIIDLEIYYKLFPLLDVTYTKTGSFYFKNMLKSMCHSFELVERQNIIKKMSTYKDIHKYISKELLNIRNKQYLLDWLVDIKTDVDMYFKRQYLNNTLLLGATNFMKIYVPCINIIIYLIIYLFLYYLGIKINIKDYIIGMYNGYLSFVENTLYMISDKENINSFLANIIVSLYVLYQLYLSIMSIESSLRHRKKCLKFKSNILGIYSLIDSIYNIYKIDIFFTNDIRQDLIKIMDLFSYEKINNLGYILNLKLEYTTYKHSLDSILKYVGMVDSYVAIVNLITMRGYTLPTYDFNKNKPYIHVKNVWNPLLPFDQVLNDFTFDSKLMIITGANTSGKSTYMRSVMLAVYLSQTLGISCCSSITFTPFNVLFTYINIPDVVGRESLFEAEMNRCMQFINLVKGLKNDQYAFTIIDELFTGTNPKEGIAGSFAISEYMLSYPNSLCIVSTHFHDITKLSDLKPGYVENKKFEVQIDPNGEINKNYKIVDGVSNQNIAIYLLKKKGFDPTIISIAERYMS